ncbi:hypothetical protein G6O67_008230 [Ophiocordyceps sinensis]|uniref:Demethylmenaquinone methyltransferase n=1 Tax=Ophiocordyceps sinensis TaxID=72228 RepID=A0A8H4LSI9_9HYPO|nr:hypothetical protein G6O67_008230 [Ophiocordyceps sinensis]
MAPISAHLVAQLQTYTACDISDALLKLKVPGAGFIADLNLYCPQPGQDTTPTIAPVSTVLFIAKGETPADPVPNIPDGLHWSDATEPGSFIVIKQPPGQTNAVCGGIMALRIKIRGAKGVAVAGRVRDLAELRSTNLPILAYGTSTVGAGGGSVPWALQVPLNINGTVVKPGDIAFHDPASGLVIIPRDEKDVLGGMSVHEAFKLHRGA